MIKTLRATAFTGPIADHGEGPVWNTADETIEWVDMFAGDLLSCDPRSGAVLRHHAAPMLAAFRHRAAGGYVLATEAGFRLVDAAKDTEVEITAFNDSTVRMNDAGCDHRGRFYAGTMAYDASLGRGRVYRLDPDFSVRVVLEDATISNGIGFPEHSDVAVFVDSQTNAIRRYDTAGERWQLLGSIMEIDPGLGTPDGLCLDRDGGVWVALWGGSAVHRYSADGRHTHTVELPVSQPTSCALGGKSFDQLFITSSAHGLTAGGVAQAGSLFTVRVDVPGFPAHRFAG